jgi:hypothetical protein
MSIMEPEVVADTALVILQALEEEMEIVCDIASKRGESGWPQCPDRKAEWVAWRGDCCPNSPRYFLMCRACRVVYETWYAMGAALACGWCEAPSDGPLTFAPLRGVL